MPEPTERRVPTGFTCRTVPKPTVVHSSWRQCYKLHVDFVPFRLIALVINHSVSQEEDAEDGHDIVPNGYDIGRYVASNVSLSECLFKFCCRDSLVSAAIGTTSYDDVTYYTVAQNITGLMPAGSNGVNHGMLIVCSSSRVIPNFLLQGIAVDGIVTLLTVTIQ